jgi:uncharacterized membrane protein HdeD (DUF308 family)
MKDFALRLLGLWLILYGWQAFTTPGYTYLSIMMGCIALIAGFILLFGRGDEKRATVPSPAAGNTPSP